MIDRNHRSHPGAAVRVAIACSGLEHIRRGFESASRELFDALSGSADITLFKGSGASSATEIVVPCLRRGFLTRFMEPQRAFHWEQLTFAFALLPYLLLKRIDIVHYTEAYMGHVLARLLRWIRSPIKLVLMNGGPLSPEFFGKELFIQQVSQEGLELALRHGIEPSRMYLIPHAVAPDQFRVSERQEILRERFGLPADKFVILSLAALNKHHKRHDYLIREVAALHDDSLLLCMAGEPTADTPDLRRLAAELLPGRHQFLTVPRAKVAELLHAADLFVHGALYEGFGLVLLEACSAGLPTMCHRTPHFEWVLGDAGIYVDMSKAGALSTAIRSYAANQELLASHGRLSLERVRSRFSWQVLGPQYLKMYQAVYRS